MLVDAMANIIKHIEFISIFILRHLLSFFHPEPSPPRNISSALTAESLHLGRLTKLIRQKNGICEQKITERKASI